MRRPSRPSLRLALTGVFLLPLAGHAAAAPEAKRATLTVRADRPGPQISRHIYGHFAEHLGRCIYDGLWVGPQSTIPNTRGIRNDVIDDGVGPVAQRPRRVNIHWGGVVEDNSFGTHEFLDFCELTGAEPYIAANVGSGTPQEMAEWVEYMTFGGDSTLAARRAANGRKEPWKVPFLGIGNENWGCGGQMTPEYYSDLYRRFSVYARDWQPNKLTRIAAGPGGTRLDALKMESLLTEAEQIMARHDPKGQVGLYVDEWGTWYTPLPGSNPAFLVQQNSMRDAVVAGATFNIFHAHAQRVKMANIAQLVNVLQALILTEGEKMLLTPTYHVFDMYQVHHDATFVPVDLKTDDYALGAETIPAVSASASRDAQGRVHLSLVNLDPRASVAVSGTIEGAKFTAVTGRVLTAPAVDTHNTFEAPNRLRPAAFTGAALRGSSLTVALPARSVVVLALAP